MPGSTVPPDTGMYTPVRQAQQARLIIRVVAPLPAKTHRVFVRRRRMVAGQDAVVLAQGSVSLVELRVVGRRGAK